MFKEGDSILWAYMKYKYSSSCLSCQTSVSQISASMTASNVIFARWWLMSVFIQYVFSGYTACTNIAVKKHEHEADSLGLNSRRNFRQAISLRSTCNARSLAASSWPLWTRLDRVASGWDKMNDSSTCKHGLFCHSWNSSYCVMFYTGKQQKTTVHVAFLYYYTAIYRVNGISLFKNEYLFYYKAFLYDIQSIFQTWSTSYDNYSYFTAFEQFISVPQSELICELSVWYRHTKCIQLKTHIWKTEMKINFQTWPHGSCYNKAGSKLRF